MLIFCQLPLKVTLIKTVVIIRSQINRCHAFVYVGNTSHPPLPSKSEAQAATRSLLSMQQPTNQLPVEVIMQMFLCFSLIASHSEARPL